jgi:diguanylate cyclase (GGDEF)-like protein/PAS domain S-box-containing protein
LCQVAADAADRRKPRLLALLPEGTALPHEVWVRRHHWILAILWLHVPAVFIFSQVQHVGVVHGLVETSAIAGMALVATRSQQFQRLSTVTAAVGLLTCSAVLVHLSHGTIEMHFHYFVMVGVVTLYQDWWPFLVAIGYVVLQHGVAGVVSPESVYNHQSAIDHPWTWAGIHGAFILAMSCAGIASWKLNESFLGEVTRRSEQLAEAQQVAHIGSWDHDLVDGVTVWTPELYRLLGLKPDVVRASVDVFLDRVVAEDRPALQAAISAMSGEGIPYATDVRILTAGGELRWLHVKGGVTGWQHGRPRAVSGTAQDVTETKRAEEDLRATLSLLNATLDSTADGILVVDLEGRITSVNRRFAEMWDLPSDVLDERDDKAALEYVMGKLADPPAFVAKVNELYASPEAESHDVIEFTDGSILDRYSTPQRVAGTIVGRVWSFRDITGQKRLESELAHQAQHDSLTGLANQTLFRDRVSHALARTSRRHEHLAVLFIDLDNFKTVNDSLGHSYGDEVLVAVARKLEACLRASDTTARLGGDEFAVLLEGLIDETQAGEIADLILTSMQEPVQTSKREVVIAASVGIAFGSEDIDAGHLLRNADLAMYSAKRNGKGRYDVYRPQLHTAAVERLELESDLRVALERGELTVHYQPIVALATDEVVGCEALVRWHHPRRGTLAPDVFIPMAEETGLIEEVGRQVLEMACKAASSWRERHGLDSLTVSVNVSPRQLLNERLVEDVRGALERARLAPAALVLEITESAMLQDTESTLGILRRIKALGVRLAIDDFGTGYSSLSYLQRFPLDILKIDRAFVTAIDHHTDDASLAPAVVSMANTMHLKVVAEGVETRTQADALSSMGCDLGQGFLLARPMPAEAMDDLLEARGAPARTPDLPTVTHG